MLVANYHDERKALESLATSVPSCAIYVRADENYGKTCIVGWLAQEVAGRARAVVVDLDPPQRSMTPDLVMRVIAQELGWEHFQHFRTESERLTPRRQATIENVTVNGSHNIITASAGSTIEDQLSLAIDLTASFLECLREAAKHPQPKDRTPVILCLDGYDRNSRLMSSWLELSLLPGLTAPTSGKPTIANVVISGRCVAPPELFPPRAKTHILELNGVHDVQEWVQVATDLKRRLPGDDPGQAQQRLIGIISYARGEPGGIMTYLRSLPEA